MSKRHGILGCLRLASFVSLLLVFASPALATGPVPVSALPGGGSVVDSDTGNGQAWGRAGGRTLTFTINDLTQFSALAWGLVSGTNPTLAFDNAVDASGETMAFQSNSNGVATWTGAAVLQLASPPGSFNVPTRFILTVTDANNVPIPLTFQSGGVNPGASVIATHTFKVNERFEMFWNGAWSPVLDEYDALGTIPGNPPSSNTGPVITGVQTGFYYTGAGITLEDHDANMNAQLAAIKGDTSFIRTDNAGRLQGIANDLGDVKSSVGTNLWQSVSQIAQNVSQLLNNGSGNVATHSDIQGLQQMFFILWGLQPCPDPQMCAGVKFVKDLATQASVDALSGKVDGVIGGVGALQSSVNGLASQASVNGLASQASVSALQGAVSTLQSKVDALAGVVADAPLQLSVAQIASPGNTMRWIVTTSRDGTLVPGTLQGIIAVLTTGSPSTASDVLSRATVTQVSPGVLDVSLNVVKSVTDGSAFVFKARATDATGSSDATALVVPK